MSKLIKFKKNFTLTEAANYLSTLCEEPIFLSDIYEFVLSGELTLSIRFMNPTYGLKGRIIQGQDGDMFQLSKDLVTGEQLDEPQIGYIDDNAIPMCDENWLVYDNKVHSIDGIWDIQMIGIGRLEIEKLYSREVNAPEPLYTEGYGIYLTQGEVICRLQREDLQKINERNDEINYLLASDGISIHEFRSGKFGNLAQEKNEYLKHLLSQSDYFNIHNYDDPMNFKEQSHQFIIKAIELSRFIQSAKDEEKELSSEISEKPLAVKERNTFLTVIRAMCLELGIKPEVRGSATPIQKITEIHGEPVSNETIRKILLKINQM